MNKFYRIFVSYRGFSDSLGNCLNLILFGELQMDGTRRDDIRPGIEVAIVLKKDQRSGLLTEGVVKNLLTKSPTHPHGIKVRLEDGQVGRVKEIRE